MFPYSCTLTVLLALGLHISARPGSSTDIARHKLHTSISLVCYRIALVSYMHATRRFGLLALLARVEDWLAAWLSCSCLEVEFVRLDCYGCSLFKRQRSISLELSNE
uniref:Secreted protein n=1 Tax=Arundo donax TaxID=35708 RepID=A0A0A9BUD8_ARUDO